MRSRAREDSEDLTDQDYIDDFAERLAELEVEARVRHAGTGTRERKKTRARLDKLRRVAAMPETRPMGRGQASPSSSSGRNTGEIRIRDPAEIRNRRPGKIGDTNGWRNLVLNKHILICPSKNCGVNAQIRGPDLHYFKGYKGFIMHITLCHPDMSALLSGLHPDSRKPWLHSLGRPLTKVENEAYKNGGQGIVVTACLPENDTNRKWYEARKANILNEPVHVATPSVGGSRKRPRVEEQSEVLTYRPSLNKLPIALSVEAEPPKKKKRTLVGPKWSVQSPQTPAGYRSPVNVPRRAVQPLKEMRSPPPSGPSSSSSSITRRRFPTVAHWDMPS